MARRGAREKKAFERELGGIKRAKMPLSWDETRKIALLRYSLCLISSSFKTPLSRYFVILSVII